MKAVLLLATLPLLALVPTANAVDLCSTYGLCIPPIVNGCHVNAYVVRADLPTGGCALTATLYDCDVDYFGGSGSILGNFVFRCTPILTLP